MGCGDSRFRDRRENIDDLNCAHVHFLGGPDFHWMNDAEQAAADRLALAHTNNEEPASIYKFNGHTMNVSTSKSLNQESVMNGVFNELIESLQNKRARLKREFERTYDKKAVITG